MAGLAGSSAEEKREFIDGVSRYAKDGWVSASLVSPSTHLEGASDSFREGSPRVSEGATAQEIGFLCGRDSGV